MKCFKCKNSDTEAPKPLYSCATCFVAGCWQGEFHLKAHFNETHPLGTQQTLVSLSVVWPHLFLFFCSDRDNFGCNLLWPLWFVHLEFPAGGSFGGSGQPGPLFCHSWANDA